MLSSCSESWCSIAQEHRGQDGPLGLPQIEARGGISEPHPSPVPHPALRFRWPSLAVPGEGDLGRGHGVHLGFKAQLCTFSFRDREQFPPVKGKL